MSNNINWRQTTVYHVNRGLSPIILSLFVIFTGLSYAADVFQSGTERVHVLELYTSEGCSSCPPADRWLSDLKKDDRLWRELIPLAFHVDYWDYIGWRDRFASHIFSDRQRRYARDKGISTVYTPGFLLDGREWRAFFGLRKVALDADVGAGNLIARLDQRTLQASYQPGDPGHDQLVLNVAVLGFDIITKVEAGENRGEQLHHDFTVLGYTTSPMSAGKDGYTGTMQLPPVTSDAPRLGIAVWVNIENDLTPLQAAGGWIKR